MSDTQSTLFSYYLYYSLMALTYAEEMNTRMSVHYQRNARRVSGKLGRN